MHSRANICDWSPLPFAWFVVSSHDRDWKRTKFLRVLRFQMRSVCPVVFPISSLNFITIVSDFYVSISKHARASSVPINTACRLGPTIPATREYHSRNITYIYANFYRFWTVHASSLKPVGSLAPIIGPPRSFRVHCSEISAAYWPPRERTCDLVGRFRQLGETGPYNVSFIAYVRSLVYLMRN